MPFEEVIIGNARLIHSDCREVLPGLPKHDFLLTDPPYGINADKGVAEGGFDGTKRYARKPKRYDGGWDVNRPTAGEFETILCAVETAIIWGGNYFSDFLPRGGRWLIWDKRNSMPSYSDGEIAWTNLRGVVVKMFRQCNNGTSSLRDGERNHPTQKPVALMLWCLEQAGNPPTVLDPFMGSGTTGVACAQLGLAFTGIELERKYFDIACRRIERAQAQGKLLLPDAPQRAVQEGMFGDAG